VEDLSVWRLEARILNDGLRQRAFRQHFPFHVSPPSLSLGLRLSGFFDSLQHSFSAHQQKLQLSVWVSARRVWGEMLSTRHRHQIVLLCVFPAFVRFCVSLVSLVATILGAIHVYQQMNDHRKWEVAYAFWKGLGMASFGARTSSGSVIICPWNTCQLRPHL